MAGEVGDPQANSAAYLEHPQVQEFLRYLRLKNLSESTVRGYMAVLGSAFRMVGLVEAAPSGVTTAQLRVYVVSLQARGLAPRTVADHVTVLKRFFGFFVQAGYLTVDPSRGRPTPKVGRRLPKTLSMAQLEQVFAVMDDRAGPGRRDKVFFQLTYAGGLRMGEVTPPNRVFCRAVGALWA